jgi:glycerol uptake facilitator-like aquaporin
VKLNMGGPSHGRCHHRRHGCRHAASLGRRYLIRFEEDTLRQRPLWIRLIIEFLGTFVLVTVAAGAGVINHYAGGGPITRAAALIAPGAVMEIVLTTILVSVIFNTATGGRSIGHNAAIAVGSTVALLGLFDSPISGASMNPARTLGPDIVANDYTGWWVYVAGPVIGAAIAVMIIGLVRGLPDRDERAAAEGGDLPILGSPAPDGRRAGAAS